MAMGDAQVALAEGALAALWNPAGLGGLTANEVLFSHNKWLDDITDQRFIAAFALKTWALSPWPTSVWPLAICRGLTPKATSPGL
ncbi:MAG: hypothetical protein IPN23_07825 [Elusimicrobia bacterium]|nr:hypothetical protein [Elusimicrobiota bacterium]